MFTGDAYRQMLDGASSLAWVQYHSGWPGSAGTSNVIAVSRASVSWNAANGEYRKSTNAVGTTIPVGETFAWITLWDASTGGNYCGAAPVGGHPLEFYADPGDDRVHVLGGHPFVNSDKVVFYGGTPPAPLAEGTPYYARDCVTDTFRVATSAGGGATDITAPGEVTCVVSSTTGPIAAVGGAVITIPALYMRTVRNYGPVWI